MGKLVSVRVFLILYLTITLFAGASAARSVLRKSASARTVRRKSKPRQAVGASSEIVVNNEGGVLDSYATSPVYHVGPVLSRPVNIYVVWYGAWASADQELVRDFLRSFRQEEGVEKQVVGLRGGQPSSGVPSVVDWWQITYQYADREGNGPSPLLALSGEHMDTAMSQGPALTRNSTQYALKAALRLFGGTFPLDTSGMYLVLSSPEVRQESFCDTACGFHSFTFPGLTSEAAGLVPAVESTLSVGGVQLPYAWVGNPAKQCPGFCGFPYAAPAFLPAKFAALVKPPNGNLGVDALISTLAHEMAEVATDPFMNGWYTGDSRYPLEIADACLGTFGSGAVPGNPGKTLPTPQGAAYNTVGHNGRKFLLPHLWDAKHDICAGHA